MRPVLALLITLSLLGGVFGYVRFADSVRRTAVDLEIDYAEGIYSIEIQSTFDCEADPILETEALKVLFKGTTVFTGSELISGDETIEIKPLDGVESGENEIFISANRKTPAQGLGAMKVTVKRNDIPVVEKLLTSVPGLPTVSGPVVFEIPATKKPDAHDH
jgi:hypothetical protein